MSKQLPIGSRRMFRGSPDSNSVREVPSLVCSTGSTSSLARPAALRPSGRSVLAVLLLLVTLLGAGSARADNLIFGPRESLGRLTIMFAKENRQTCLCWDGTSTTVQIRMHDRWTRASLETDEFDQIYAALSVRLKRIAQMKNPQKPAPAKPEELYVVRLDAPARAYETTWNKDQLNDPRTGIQDLLEAVNQLVSEDAQIK